ncbi:lysylphosphatidylglycerol synthase transmembrane domain-containing protein [Larkinella insperata]|uniref:Lysylphosphatidylglycerol synthase transmembrane domain-containing protein n=1 Tax=Larkinella insperata TaxID=332158 RepID=A0ABW3Q2X0_9BACT|nr:lysylphosphatidylglycerol synthase transmembrane domain-containing protein [Larkinella insperata]
MSTKLYKALFFAIGVVTLVYMMYVMGFAAIWQSITQTGVWFLPVVGSWLVIYVLNALAFYAVIQEPQVPETHRPFGQVLRITIAGYAINYITPFVALGGEPYRIMELKPALGVRKASSSVILYSLMHMFSHIIFWLVSIVLIVAFLPLTDLMLWGCGILLVVGLALGYWFIRVYKKGFTVSTVRLLEKLPLVGRKARALSQEKAETLLEIDHQIRILYADRKPRFYASLLLEFVGRVVGCLEIYFVARALNLNMSVVESLIVSSGSSLFANLIFFFPMQLGTREGGLALALRWIGFPAASGVFIGVVMRIREFVWILIGLALLRVARSKPVPQPAELITNE